MEIGQLEAFERAAREGSFTEAANVLGLTQPAISTRIATLEAELGAPLFERSGRRLRLTSLGQTVLPYAERVLATLADAAQAASQHQQGQRGRVAVAALDTHALPMLPAPMARFRNEYPAVDLTIFLRIRRQILNKLYSGDATLGLTGAPLWDKGVRVLAHFQERVRPVVAATHPLAMRQSWPRKLVLADIYDYTIYRVSLNPHVTALIEDMAEHARRGSGGAIIYIPAIMAVPLLLEGQGVAFLPQVFVQKYVEAGQLVFLDIEDMPQLLNEPLLIALANRELDTANQAFVKMMRLQWNAILID